MSEEIPVSTELGSPRGGGGWVKFDEGDGPDSPAARESPAKHGLSSNSSGVSSARGSVNSVRTDPPAALATGAEISVSEIQVVDEATLKRKVSVPVSGVGTLTGAVTSSPNPTASISMDNVNLSDSSELPGSGTRFTRGKQFANGDCIVTMLPVNTKLPWVSPARFRPELVPEELMSPSLTLTVEEYVQTMEKLSTDMRFIVHNLFYKRILIVWISLAFIILLAVIFVRPPGPALFGAGVAWLIVNALAIFLCMWIKLKLNKKLEKCMAFINSSLLKHNIILGVDDRGKLSCQKVNLCFIYLESADCIKKLEQILDEKPPEDATQNGNKLFDREEYLKTVEEFDDVEVVVPGRPSAKVNRKRDRAEKLFLHYIQRWAKDYLRRRLDWMVEDMYGRQEYASNTNPRHIRSALCPCQYIEEHLRNKRQRESLNPCAVSPNPCHWCE